MATYDKLSYNLAAYHEGNEADWEFDLDSNFPFDQISEISFQARTTKGVLVMPEKLLTTNGLTLVIPTVRIPFTAEQMKGNPGDHFYEIDFLNLQGKPFATIGGKFPIIAEINRR